MSLVTSSFAPLPVSTLSSLYVHRPSTPLPLNSASWLSAQSAEDASLIYDLTASTTSTNGLITAASSVLPSRYVPLSATTSLIPVVVSGSVTEISSIASNTKAPGFGSGDGYRPPDLDHPGPNGWLTGVRDDGKDRRMSTAHLVVLMVLLGMLTLGFTVWLLWRSYAQRRLRTQDAERGEISDEEISSWRRKGKGKEIVSNDIENGNGNGNDNEKDIEPKEPFDDDESVMAERSRGRWARRAAFLKSPDRDIREFHRIRDAHDAQARRPSAESVIPSLAPIAVSDVANVTVSRSGAGADDDEGVDVDNTAYWEIKRMESERVTAALNKAQQGHGPLPLVMVTVEDLYGEAKKPKATKAVHIFGNTSSVPEPATAAVKPHYAAWPIDVSVPVAGPSSVAGSSSVTCSSTAPGTSSSAGSSIVPPESVKGLKPVVPATPARKGTIVKPNDPVTTPVTRPVKSLMKVLSALPKSPLVSPGTATANLGRLMLERMRKTPPRIKRKPVPAYPEEGPCPKTMSDLVTARERHIKDNDMAAIQVAQEGLRSLQAPLKPLGPLPAPLTKIGTDDRKGKRKEVEEYRSPTESIYGLYKIEDEKKASSSPTTDFTRSPAPLDARH